MKKSLRIKSNPIAKKKNLLTVIVKWNYNYSHPMSTNLKNAIRKSAPPIKSLFEKIVEKRSSLRKSKITWKSTSEIIIERLPEKKLNNFVRKIEEIDNRMDFATVRKIKISSLNI